MNILVDENLKNEWCKQLEKDGHVVKYWPDVKDNITPDQNILDWAKNEKYVVFTKYNQQLILDITVKGSEKCPYIIILSIEYHPKAKFVIPGDPEDPHDQQDEMRKQKSIENLDPSFVRPILKAIRSIESEIGEGKIFKIDEDGNVEPFGLNKD